MRTRCRMLITMPVMSLVAMAAINAIFGSIAYAIGLLIQFFTNDKKHLTYNIVVNVLVGAMALVVVCVCAIVVGGVVMLCCGVRIGISECCSSCKTRYIAQEYQQI